MTSLQIAPPLSLEAPHLRLRQGQKCAAVLRGLCAVLASATLVAAGVFLVVRRVPQDGNLDGDVANNKEACLAWASKVTRMHDGSEEALRGKRNCEAQCLLRYAVGKRDWDMMDPPLNDTFITMRDADALPKWSTSRTAWPWETWTRGDIAVSKFGKAKWYVPVGLSAEESRHRMLFIHGCDSECDVTLRYYATMVTRIAHHLRMPVLAGNFAQEPEYPWPLNVKSVLALVAYIADHGPYGKDRIHSLFLSGDSEGSLLTMQVVLALVNESAPRLLGVPPSLQAEGTAEGTLPLAGAILYSPALDMECRAQSFHVNCWDEGKGYVIRSRDGDRRGWGGPLSRPCQNTTFDDRIYDCQWMYVTSHFGLEGTYGMSDRYEAHRRYMARPESFWRNPLINPMRFNYSTKGAPALLVISGEEDYLVSDGVNLAARACETGGDAEIYLAAGMWHDFQEYSEGCGGPNATPLVEGIEAYRRSARWARARRRGLPKPRAQSAAASSSAAPVKAAPARRPRRPPWRK